VQASDHDSRPIAVDAPVEIVFDLVSALQGVSDGDAEALRSAFNVKTVRDLGRNKFFRAAQALTLLGEAGAK
jgi:hypothetical protein